MAGGQDETDSIWNESFLLGVRKNNLPMRVDRQGKGCPQRQGPPCRLSATEGPPSLNHFMPVWKEQLFTVTVQRVEGHYTSVKRTQAKLTSGTSNKHFYTEGLGGRHRPGAVTHRSDAGGSTGTALDVLCNTSVCDFYLKSANGNTMPEARVYLVHHILA